MAYYNKNKAGKNATLAHYDSSNKSKQSWIAEKTREKKERLELLGADIDVSNLTVGEELISALQIKIEMLESQIGANIKKIKRETLLTEAEKKELNYENSLMVNELEIADLKLRILNNKGYASFPVLTTTEGIPIPNCSYVGTKKGPMFLVKVSEDKNDNIWIDPAKLMEGFDIRYEKHIAWVYANKKLNGYNTIFKANINYYTGEQFNPKTKQLVRVKGLSDDELATYVPSRMCFPYIEEYIESTGNKIASHVPYEIAGPLMKDVDDEFNNTPGKGFVEFKFASNEVAHVKLSLVKSINDTTDSTNELLLNIEEKMEASSDDTDDSEADCDTDKSLDSTESTGSNDFKLLTFK